MINRTPVILAPDGKAARLPKDAACPQCGAPASKRVPESGFGTPKEICGNCGFEDF